LIGRSSVCQIVVEDALVSRKHARIDVSGDDVVLHDLRSLNGTMVNGAAVQHATSLNLGDVVRVGSHDLQLTAAEGFDELDAATQAMNSALAWSLCCVVCGVPLADSSSACLHCGCVQPANALLGDVTQTHRIVVGQRESWGVQLFVEVLELALERGRIDDARRVLARATSRFDEQLQRDVRVDAAELSRLAEGAAKASVVFEDPSWVTWISRAYVRASLVPPERVVAHLAQAVSRFPDSLAAHIVELETHARSLASTASEGASVAALERLAASVSAFGPTSQGFGSQVQAWDV